jgi:hypothetical protein
MAPSTIFYSTQTNQDSQDQGIKDPKDIDAGDPLVPDDVDPQGNFDGDGDGDGEEDYADKDDDDDHSNGFIYDVDEGGDKSKKGEEEKGRAIVYLESELFNSLPLIDFSLPPPFHPSGDDIPHTNLTAFLQSSKKRRVEGCQRIWVGRNKGGIKC